MKLSDINPYLEYESVSSAYKNASQFFRKTPTIKSKFLSESTGTDVYLKLENTQVTGAFKIRGALNALMHLDPKKNSETVVCASSGSHAMGMCQAGRFLNKGVIVFLPEITPQYKIEKIRKLGGRIKIFGEYLPQAQDQARKFAEENNLNYISPYNNIYTIQGNGGFIAHEIMSSNLNFDSIFAPIGGGGFIAGLSSVLKSNKPSLKVVGVESKNNPTMHNAILNNDPSYPVESRPSIAEALTGKVPLLCFNLIKKNVDKLSLVSENDIKHTMKLLLKEEKIVVEGAGAITAACLIFNKLNIQAERSLLIVTGGNIKESAIHDLQLD